MEQVSIPASMATFNVSVVFTPYNIACKGKVASLTDDDDDYGEEKEEEAMQNPLSERAKKKKRLMKGCLNAEQRKCNR
jgi:hypothetical protein